MRTLCSILLSLSILPALVMGEAPPAVVKVVAVLDQAPGNITVIGDDRVIVSLHQFFDSPYPVAEITADGQAIPFPAPPEGLDAPATLPHLDSVLGIQADRRGVVWMLDNGLRGGGVPKLVGWDTKGNRLSKLIYLPPPVTVEKSFVNDLAVVSASV